MNMNYYFLKVDGQTVGFNMTFTDADKAAAEINYESGQRTDVVYYDDNGRVVCSKTYEG